MEKIMMFEEYKAHKRKKFIKFVSIVSLTVFLIWLIFFFRTPYSIIRVGGVDDAKDRIFVEGGHGSKGKFSIVYVEVTKGTIFNLVTTMFEERELIYSEDSTLDDYIDRVYSRSSYENAVVNLLILLEEEGIEVDYDEYVSYVFNDVTCDLRIGDEILKYDGITLDKPQPFIDYVQAFVLPANITLELKGADQTTRTVTCDLQKLEGRNIVGYGYLGINRLVSEHTVVDRIDSYVGVYKGPSSGFVVTMELYNQLVMGDITNGYDIVATGTIEYDGSIGQIGFVELKLIAAEQSGADFLFVADNDKESSNYKVAKRMKEEKGYDIEIVRINHISEALEFLKGLE